MVHVIDTVQYLLLIIHCTESLNRLSNLLEFLCHPLSIRNDYSLFISGKFINYQLRHNYFDVISFSHFFQRKDDWFIIWRFRNIQPNTRIKHKIMQDISFALKTSA